MRSAAVNDKPSLQQAAKAAGILLLAGVTLAYAFGNGSEQAALPPIVPGAGPVADQLQPDPPGVAYNRLNKLAARAQSTGYSATVADPASGLATLHQHMLGGTAQRIDRDRVVIDLDTEHRAEPIDAAWSAQSEVNILSASVTPVMIQAGFSPDKVATDCRSRTCRISAQFASSGDAQGWANRLLTQMGGTLSQVKMTLLPQADGSFEVRMYGARKQSSGS